MNYINDDKPGILSFKPVIYQEVILFFGTYTCTVNFNNTFYVHITLCELYRHYGQNKAT